MSLKAFHLFFISVSTVFALLFAAWSVREFLDDGGSGYALAACASIAAGCGLAVYGVRFARKLKDVSFL